MNTVEDRATLLATGFSRGRTIPIYNDHPTVHNTIYHSQVEKVTIQELPLNVDNKDIETLIKSFPAVKFIGGIRNVTAKDPDGKWSNFKNADRFWHIKAPVTVPLPNTAEVGMMPCRIYHRSQRLFKKMQNLQT